jgi:hypothetical protein
MIGNMHEMRKVLIPELQPGCCVRCLSAPGENRDYFIDPGFNTFDGIVYLCDRCVADLVKVDGRYISVAEHEKKRLEWIDVLTQFHEMKAKYDSLIKEIGETVERASARDVNTKSDGDKSAFAFGTGIAFGTKADAVITA